MLYTVGSRDDWNLYSTLTNSARWTWTAIQPLIQKIEKYVAPNDHHDTVRLSGASLRDFRLMSLLHQTGQYDPAIHSTTGKVSVSLAGYPVPLDPRVVRCSVNSFLVYQKLIFATDEHHSRVV